MATDDTTTNLLSEKSSSTDTDHKTDSCAQCVTESSKTGQTKVHDSAVEANRRVDRIIGEFLDRQDLRVFCTE